MSQRPIRIQEMNLYANGLESAVKAAKTIVLFLTQRHDCTETYNTPPLTPLPRSGKTKVTKSSNEAEYRAIFDNFISDLLAVLFWPEWPAASLLLGIICKVMASRLLVPLNFYSFPSRLGHWMM